MQRHTRSRAVIEWIVILAVAVLAALLLRAFVVEPFFIPSGSMETTLDVGDRVLVNRLSYDFHSVHRGDIIVFSKPPHDVLPGINDLIKRVIGLPGETITAHGGWVYINGTRLQENWLPEQYRGITTFPTHVPGCLPSSPPSSCIVPRGEYFVMGDHRNDSEDSRMIGPIPGHLIVGRAFLRVWPLSRIGFL